MNNLPEIVEDAENILTIVANKISLALEITESLKGADPEALYTKVSTDRLFSLVKDIAHAMDTSYKELDTHLG